MTPTLFLRLFLTTMLQALKSHMIAVVTWLVALAWTIVVGGSLVWTLRNDERETMDTAYAEARANLNKDLTLRRWATDHGGVYVPITERQQSIPWLSHVPGRDVTTTDGRQLTLLNPATAVRQMMDRYAQDYGVRGRITGLKYLNPSNAPDAWETTQLEAFTRGEKSEIWEVSDFDGKPHLRYLRAMFMEPGCEKCHAILGYQLGDMRGATGLNLPLASYYQKIEESKRILDWTHGVIWLFGLTGIGLSSSMVRRRELALRQFKAIIDSSDDAIISTALDGNITSWNQGAETLFGYQAGEAIGQSIQIIIPAARQNEEADILTRILRSEKIDHFDTVRCAKDGRLIDISVSVSPILSSHGKVIGASKIARNITERKQSTEALKLSLKEKTALLNEVHHRVKNNLQVVTSLLHLEARRSDHPGTQAVLKDMQDRIRSMALLHESIYRAGTFAAIDLGSYLGQLATQAFRTLLPRMGVIQLRLELGSVQVGLDQATPCGLLVSELLSNCLKHGFSDGGSGEVCLELQPVAGGAQWMLRVSDTGVGLPADFQLRRQTSLGLQLVAGLAHQLGGSLEAGPGPRAVFSVTFTPQKPAPLVLAV
jgi:PAS domain S-box-containing protein